MIPKAVYPARDAKDAASLDSLKNRTGLATVKIKMAAPMLNAALPRAVGPDVHYSYRILFNRVSAVLTGLTTVERLVVGQVLYHCNYVCSWELAGRIRVVRERREGPW